MLKSYAIGATRRLATTKAEARKQAEAAAAIVCTEADSGPTVLYCNGDISVIWCDADTQWRDGYARRRGESLNPATNCSVHDTWYEAFRAAAMDLAIRHWNGESLVPHPDIVEHFDSVMRDSFAHWARSTKQYQSASA